MMIKQIIIIIINMIYKIQNFEVSIDIILLNIKSLEICLYIVTHLLLLYHLY